MKAQPSSDSGTCSTAVGFHSSQVDPGMKSSVSSEMICSTHVHGTPWFAWLHLVDPGHDHDQRSDCDNWIAQKIGALMRSVSDQTIIVLTACFPVQFWRRPSLRLPVPLTGLGASVPTEG